MHNTRGKLTVSALTVDAVYIWFFLPCMIGTAEGGGCPNPKEEWSFVTNAVFISACTTCISWYASSWKKDASLFLIICKVVSAW